MNLRAFDVLGLEPTTDGRAIRAAFVRLARIYHPDRFAGMPDDVRAEAERRMKEATIAYETLRAERKSERSEEEMPALDGVELQERARKYRETIEAKDAQNKRDRARWRRWAEIEKETRDRAALEAQVAAAVVLDVNGHPNGYVRAPVADPSEEPAKSATSKEESLFSKRLASARGGQTAPLEKRRPD